MASLQTARSFLFAPGSEERKLVRALGSGADAVVADLEDAVAAAEKAAARDMTTRLVAKSETKTSVRMLNPRDCAGMVYYLPTPKSPHGVDVDPSGEGVGPLAVRRRIMKDEVLGPDGVPVEPGAGRWSLGARGAGPDEQERRHESPHDSRRDKRKGREPAARVPCFPSSCLPCCRFSHAREPSPSPCP